MSEALSVGSRTPALVGALGAPGLAEVDRQGAVAPRGRPFELVCWIGAEDGWRCGDDAGATRQERVGTAPVIETITSVPGGEAVQRVWGLAERGGIVVVDVENRSTAAFAVAFALRPQPGEKCRVVDLRDSMVRVEGRPAAAFARPPRAWAVAPAGTGAMLSAVTGGGTTVGEFGRHRDRRGLESAFVFPVPHRASVRAAVLLDPVRSGEALDLAAVPDSQAVARGWRSHLERGMRTELPDEVLQRAVDVSRATLLLDAAGTRGSDADAVAALEDWGFDSDATIAWQRLGIRARRAASHRAPSVTDPWMRVRTYLAAASQALTFPGGPAPFLRAVRDLIVREHDGGIDLLPVFPREWLGRDLAVHGIPTREGSVSFALRWHGERPALLWDAPTGLSVTASLLDPHWRTSGGAGEALLPERPGPQGQERET